MAFLICGAAGVGLTVLYWEGGQPQAEGILLAVAFGALAVGFVLWANELFPKGPFVEERHVLATSAEEEEAFGQALERGGEIGRRTMILRALGVAIGGLGVAAVFPIRSLGPRPSRSLSHTPWRNGLRLVTVDSRPVRPTDVPVNGLVTVFPEGSAGSADGQAVLIRLPPNLIRPRPGRGGWSPEGFIAYSKVCTHAGCPVGLYAAQSHQLLCPCHQSTFDVLRGAEPLFGPAAVPLPQLPLRISPDGYLEATGDFSSAVGPYFWHRQ